MPFGYPWDLFDPDPDRQSRGPLDSWPQHEPESLWGMPANSQNGVGRLYPMAGRRERSFLWLTWSVIGRDADLLKSSIPGGHLREVTLRELWELCEAPGDLHDALSSIPLRYNLEGIAEDRHVVTEVGQLANAHSVAKDPELHPGLQDLGWILGHELTQACEAISDPDFWYPGVDEGIEPVSDDHVHLVIAATQRELQRELRRGSLPAVDLATELPFRVQRAFVERRRMHYKTYGIGSAQWRADRWSFWDVEDDPAWVPPWVP